MERQTFTKKISSEIHITIYCPICEEPKKPVPTRYPFGANISGICDGCRHFFRRNSKKEIKNEAKKAKFQRSVITVWKFKNFTAIQIYREIKVGKVEGLKNCNFVHFGSSSEI